MDKRINIFLIIIILSSCLSPDSRKKIQAKSNDYFISESEKFINEKNYLKLRKLSSLRLIKFPEDYIAAYYKALSLQELNSLAGTNFYVNYLKKHKNIPDSYKEKWTSFAINEEKNRKIIINRPMLYSYNELIDMSAYDNSVKPDIKPKILSDSNKYVYLDFSGNLYLIKKLTKSIKKINYYKTKDFALFNEYIVFNDSINLIKYNFIEEKFKKIFTFEEDKITIRSINLEKSSCIINHIDRDVLQVKYINIYYDNIQDLPNNCISESSDYKYLVIEYDDNFELFNFNGTYSQTIEGKYIGFGYNSDEIYIYNENYLSLYNLTEKTTEELLYINEVNEIKGFKALTNNRILFCYNDNFLLLTLNPFSLRFLKGELVYILKSGFLYEKNDEIYYFSFVDNSKNFIFNDKDILKNLVFPDSDSSFFLIKDDQRLIVNIFNDFFL